MEKINVQVLRREKTRCNKFREQNLARNKFHEEKNQHVTSSMNKISSNTQ